MLGRQQGGRADVGLSGMVVAVSPVQLVPCNGKGRKFCRWEQKRDVVPSISSQRPQNPAWKANSSKEPRGAYWHLLSTCGMDWDGMGTAGRPWEV